WGGAASPVWQQPGQPLHPGVLHLVSDLNTYYRSAPALYSADSSPAGFEWIDASDVEGNVICFLRIGTDGSRLACIANFSGGPHNDYRVGLPHAGTWREALNTHSDINRG